MLTATVPQPTRAIGARVPLPKENALTLAVLGRPLLAIVVGGTPETQGSKAAAGSYRKRTKAGNVVTVPRLVDSSEAHDAELRRWRSQVCAAAVAARPLTWQVLDGPLVADMVFSLPRTTRTPKTLRTLPDTADDLDKLARATGDGIGTDPGKVNRPIIANDARIVSFRRLDKVFERDPFDPDALRHPGAVIRLWRYPEHLLGKAPAFTSDLGGTA